jgi:hypothetical protein
VVGGGRPLAARPPLPQPLQRPLAVLVRGRQGRLLSNRSDVRILRGTEVDTVDVPRLLRKGQGLLVVLQEDVIENWDAQVVCFSPKPRFRCIGGALSNQNNAFARLRD